MHILARTRPSALSTVLCLLLLLFLPHGNAAPSSTQLLPRKVTPQQHPHTPAAGRVLSWTVIRDGLLDFIPSWAKMSKHQQARSLAPRPPEASAQLRAQYGDQMILRFNISTDEEATSLAEAADILFLDVWGSSGEWVDMRVAQDVIPSLLGLLPKSLQHAHVPLMTGNELARAIAETYSSAMPSGATSTSLTTYRGFAPTSRATPGSGNDVFFENYQPLKSIVLWMKLMESLFSSHTKIISVGKSYEGRDIQALRVGVHPNNAEKPSGPRKTIIVSGGSHAREWISTSTVNYVANALITSYGRKGSVRRLLQEFDFVFIPTLNPDGYHYTWESDRLWRKNRQLTPLRFCRGLDLDRTWAYKFDAHASDNPCSESYAGSEPFQGVESSSFANWTRNETKSNNVDFVGLLDLHSYSQQILYPFSYSCHEAPPTLEDLEELGQGLAKAIRTHTQENYKVIPACEGNVAVSGKVLPRMERGGGSLLDWFYQEIGVRRAFQIKLRDKGSYGFLLPKSYIVPTGVEMLRAVEYFGRALSAAAYSDEFYSPSYEQVQQPLS